MYQAHRRDRASVAQYALAVAAACQLLGVLDEILIVRMVDGGVFAERLREVLAAMIASSAAASSSS